MVAARAAKRHAALELTGNRVGYKLGVQLGFAHLDNVQHDIFLGQQLQLGAQLIDFGAFSADDNTRSRRVDVHGHLFRRA